MYQTSILLLRINADNSFCQWWNDNDIGSDEGWLNSPLQSHNWACLNLCSDPLYAFREVEKGIFESFGVLQKKEMTHRRMVQTIYVFSSATGESEQNLPYGTTHWYKWPSKCRSQNCRVLDVRAGCLISALAFYLSPIKCTINIENGQITPPYSKI